VQGNESDDSDLQGVHPRWSNESLGSFAQRTYETHQRLYSDERGLPATVRQDQAKTPRITGGTTIRFQVLTRGLPFSNEGGERHHRHRPHRPHYHYVQHFLFILRRVLKLQVFN